VIDRDNRNREPSETGVPAPGAAEPALTRRRFLAGCAATTTALGLARCASDDPEPCLPPGPGENVDQRRFDSYRALADLDFFEVGPSGRLRCVVDMPPAVDVHVHLALAFYNASAVDLAASHDRVRHIFDCDAAGATCPIDLDVYAARSLSPEVSEAGVNVIVSTALTGQPGGPVDTHTIPNLLAEMDDLGLGGGWLLPIGMNFDYDLDNHTVAWHDAVHAHGAADRLRLFGTVHPQDPRKLEKIEAFADLGVLGIKLHPPLQGVAPDDPAAMEMYETCARRGLPIFSHVGRSGLEPPGQGDHSAVERYVAPVRDFPNLDFILGHSGAYFDADAAVALARENQNCWMCLAGPGIPAMETILAEIGPERMLFGTDWPFYPQAMQLAKVLVMTRCDARVRDMILHENAAHFVERWG
jgi:hypothetical protein